MSKINLESAKEYLDNIRIPRCFLCGQFDWDFSLETQKDDFVKVSCKHCGNTLFIDPKYTNIKLEKEQ